jgi:uncharacterized protein (TIGR02996 family)
MGKKKAGLVEQGLLADVCAHPADDGPRLVFADWLDDHGQTHRAEFIRLQCRLASMDQWAPERFALELREGDLLAVHEKAWRSSLPAWARHETVAFRRGFVHWISITATNFLRHGEALFAASPVRQLNLRNGVGRWGEVAASPRLAQLVGLDLTGNRLTNKDLRALLRSPYLAGLEALTLTGARASGSEAQVLAGWPGLARLRRLDLSYSGLKAGDLLALPGMRLAALTHLDLSGCAVSPDDIDALSGAAPALTSLVLESRNVRAEVIAALASSRLAGRLESLALDRVDVGPEALRVLADRAARLRRLRLRWTDMGPDLTDALASGRIDSLVCLDLSFGDLSADAVRRLVSCPALEGLRHLDLSCTDFGDEGARALAESPHLTALEFLDLTGCEIGPAGASALAASANWSRLLDLSLRSNPLGDEGVRAVASSPHLGRLRRLDLCNVKAGAEGARAVARSPHLGELRHLSLLNNTLECYGADGEFADPSRLPNLLTLGIGKVFPTPESLERLGRTVAL